MMNIMITITTTMIITMMNITKKRIKIAILLVKYMLMDSI
jgi:hypothetical protein